MFQSKEGWLRCLGVKRADLSYQYFARETEQSLHRRHNRYYGRRNPLEACGEAAAKLADDLNRILQGINERKVNPG
jgi:hypothetical protein